MRELTKKELETLNSETPRYKRYPKCDYRKERVDIWTRIFQPNRVGSWCGNSGKVPYCPLRTPEKNCRKMECPLSKCACCFWCPLKEKDRLEKKEE